MMSEMAREAEQKAATTALGWLETAAEDIRAERYDCAYVALHNAQEVLRGAIQKRRVAERAAEFEARHQTTEDATAGG